VAVLAESRLRGTNRDLPTNEEAAQRLGWSISTFNRRLDWLCERLRRAGVAGLKLGSGRRATGRRDRLVDHLLLSGVITTDDLARLDARLLDVDRPVADGGA
jgi:hypothetical protein